MIHNLDFQAFMNSVNMFVILLKKINIMYILNAVPDLIVVTAWFKVQTFKKI